MNMKSTLTDDERKRLERQIKSIYNYGKFTKSKEITMTDIAEALVDAQEVINIYRLALKKACKELTEEAYYYTYSNPDNLVKSFFDEAKKELKGDTNE